MGLLDNLFGTIKGIQDRIDKGVSKPEAAGQVVPETPVPFGFKVSWLCVKASSPDEVIGALCPNGAEPCGWREGFSKLNYGFFITPVLDGYVLVIGWGSDIITEDPARLDEVGAMFPEVQYFASHRVVDYAAWVKYEGGRKVRAYGWVGGSGEVFINEGELTPEETELGFTNFLPDSDADWDKYDTPDEETVVRLAAAWGINTLELDKYPASVGYFYKMI